MGMLSGAVAATRFGVVAQPTEIDFDAAAFREIEPGSEVRRRIGFLPFEPGVPYEIGARRFAFRVRVDTVRPDPTAVKERLRGLLQAELEVTGAPFVGDKKRKELRNLAEEELVGRTSPTSRIVECCLDGDLIYVASATRGHLGLVAELLRRVGVATELKTPWGDRHEPDRRSEVVPTMEPGASILGCIFLRLLLEDPEVMLEPEKGAAVVRTREAQASLSGEILAEVHRYLERGAELLSAKLILAEYRFRLEATTFRITGLAVPPVPAGHWTERLDARLERVRDLFEQLEAKYEQLNRRILAEAPELTGF